MSIKSLAKGAINAFKQKVFVPIPQSIDSSSMLKNKVAFITGGSGGIGFAIAKAFVENGCYVVISGTNEEKLKKCCLNLGEDNATYEILDFLNPHENYDYIVKEVIEKPNIDRIDILVNAAGLTVEHGFFDITEDEYDRVMNVNTKGVFFLSQSVGKYMVENKVKGNILNITSSSAIRPAWTPYQMSKWAIRGFTIGLADTLLPYGIIVNAVAPGPTATPMMGKQKGDNIYLESSPSGRYIMPSEIADLAVFLVSDKGRMIVGDSVYMTGGSGVLSYHN